MIAAEAPMPRDDLRLLSVFHYVLAGLTGLFAVIPVLYMGLGIVFVAGVLDEGQPHPPPAFIGWIFVAIGLFLLLLALGFVVALIFAGRSLARPRHWLFCMVMAGLSCAWFPFGTALGVFTLVILSKPEVKALFSAGEPVAR